MKEKELRELATCAACKRKIGATGIPFFYKVKVSRFGLDAAAMERQSGLEMMMGGCVDLAQALSPNEDLAQEVMEEKTFMICEGCSTERIVLAQLVLE